jgi:hypothetical protein
MNILAKPMIRKFSPAAKLFGCREQPPSYCRELQSISQGIKKDNPFVSTSPSSGFTDDHFGQSIGAIRQLPQKLAHITGSPLEPEQDVDRVGVD